MTTPARQEAPAVAQPKLFGTDGIRAPFGEFPLDEPTVTSLGSELAQTLVAAATAGETPLVVIGGDTRESTLPLSRWLARGLAAGGARHLFAGVVTTPAVALLVRELGAAGGIAVSASHNPHPDNGIKLFDAAGHKWSLAAEAALEERLGRPLAADPGEPALAVDEAAARRYLAFLEQSVPAARALAGLHVVLDAAHGAAAPWAEQVFAVHGARVTLLGASPDGRNINQDCGSTHPDGLAAAVAGAGADLGFAFDGDGDRAILADERGQVRDGDAMMYLWARQLAAAGQLEPRQVVATSMSNLGLEQALAAEGVEVVRCDVGDRAVMETMRSRGILLGGEQSGHIVCSRLSTTGDGLLTALQLAAAIARDGRPVSEQLAGFRRFPQVLRNVRVARRLPFAELPAVATTVERIEGELGGTGRLVLRYSGTERLARIMLEGPEQEQLERLASELAAALEESIGA